MKKTVNIHLAGMLFTIEEDAYESVKSYLERLRASLGHSKDQHEICADVEARIAELAVAKRSDRKEVITLEDVEEILQTLGDPSDFIDPDDSEANTRFTDPTNHRHERRFFRDLEKASIAGVCSGIAAYFQLDVVLVRIIFVVLGLVGGFVVPLYLILWLVTPAARTRIERLQMHGKAITVDNLKEEFEHATERIKRGGLRFEQEIKDQNSPVRKNIERIGRTFGKVLGIALILFGTLLLLSAVFTSIAEIEVFPFSDEHNLLTLNEISNLIFIDSSNSFYMQLSLFLLLTCVSLWTILTGVVLLFSLKKTWLKYLSIFLVLFGIINIIISSYQGVRLGADFTQTGIIEKEIFQASDSLFLIESLLDNEDPKLLKNKTKDIDFDLFGNQIVRYGFDVDFAESSDTSFHVIATYKAQGNSRQEGKQRAKNIVHPRRNQGNTLYLAPAFSFPKTDKIRNQRISYTILIPANKTLQIQHQLISQSNLNDIGSFDENGVYEHDFADIE